MRKLFRFNSNSTPEKSLRVGGVLKPQSVAVIPWLLGSMVAMGVGSDITSYHGNWGSWQAVRATVTAATR